MDLATTLWYAVHNRSHKKRRTHPSRVLCQNRRQNIMNQNINHIMDYPSYWIVSYLVWRESHKDWRYGDCIHFWYHDFEKTTML
jgi:hypothetical protein